MADTQTTWPPRTAERVFSVALVLVGLLVLIFFVGSLPFTLIIVVCLLALTLRVLPFYLLARARATLRRILAKGEIASAEHEREL
jgi:fatty acid desaturase